MHEILNSFKWKHIPKFQQELINFEKPQNLGFKTWNAWRMRDKKLTKWRKTWRILKKPWGSKLEWDEVVWERKERAIEREIERNEGWIAQGSINRPSVNLDRWRCREVSRHLSRKVSRNWSSIDSGIKEVSKNKPSDIRTEARLIHQLSRSYLGGRNFLDCSTRWREAVKIAIRKSVRSSTDSKVSRRCQVSF